MVAESETGTAVSMIGDYNKDGKQDFAIAAPLMTVNSKAKCGMVLIVLGKDGALSDIDMASAVSDLTMQRATTSAYVDIDLASFTTSATTGFTIAGPASFYNLGASPINIRPLGDVNGDKIDDFAVTSVRGSVPSAGAGAVWILFGQKTTFSNINLASLGSAGVLLT
eukprot:gene13816-15888_t